MKTSRSFIVIVCFSIFTAGCALLPINYFPANVNNVLDAPEKVILYSIEHSWDNKNVFHGYKVIGKTALNSKETQAVLDEIRAAHKKWGDAFSKKMTACFNPRQAIRVTSKQVTYDFIIAFECHQIEVWENDEVILHSGVTGDSVLLDSLLSNANIPLAPK